MAQMTLGEFVFSAALGVAYERMQKKTDGGWISVDRVNAKPLSQQTGRAPTTIRIVGTAFGYAGSDRLGNIGMMQATGKPFGMLDSRGNNLGRWKIMSLDFDGERIIDDGTAMKTSFTIELEEFVA